jgi:DNA-binding response OmpR family regulator
MADSQAGRKKILVVEDNPETADLLEASLQFEGYEVVKIHAVGQAIQAMLSEHPSLVLLDIMMPDVSGLEFLRYVRRDPRFDKVPILIISARATQEDFDKALEAGASSYLTKPFTQEELLTTVAKLV